MRWRRITNTLAALTLTVGLSAVGISQASAATTPDPAAAGSFLATSLAANGDHFNYAGTTFPNVGNTIDAVLALKLNGLEPDQVTASTEYLKTQVNDYVSYNGTYFSGALGKMAVLAKLTGNDPHSFGGVDLIAQLQSSYTDAGSYGTSANTYDLTINQIWAIFGLAASDGFANAASLEYLKAQQCPDGGLRGKLDDSTCTGSIDETAYAALIFGAVGDDAAQTKALDFLAAQQQASGNGGLGSPAVNANSTGLAAMAFQQAGRSTEFASAQSYLASVQYDATYQPALVGGFAYNADQASATTATQPSESDLVASTQALQGVATVGPLASKSIAVLLEPATPTETSSSSSSSATAITDPPPPTLDPTDYTFTEPPPPTSETAIIAVDPSSAFINPTTDVGGLSRTGAAPQLPVLLAVGLLGLGTALTVLTRRAGTRR